MLAQNFKAPADLGVSEIEHAALIQTLGYLERGDLPGELNLGLWYADCDDHGCGTAACIAGWAWLFSAKRAFIDVVGPDGYGSTLPWLDNRPEPLKDLFLGSPSLEHFAATALRNFLTYGEPRWEEA